MEELKGGRKGHVFRYKDNVYRPRGFWSDSIHRLLSHLEHAGFYGAPKPVGFDDKGNEILSYISGDVYNYPLIDNIATDEALTSAAEILRRYHDATVPFVSSPSFTSLKWMLPSRDPHEVICHGDFAPYNVVLNGEHTVGIIDFDTAHPGPRIWDVAYAVYCWAPFKTNPDDSLGDVCSQSARAKAFCDSYKLSNAEREILVSTMINRIQTLVDFIHSEADKGEQAFIENIRNGHHVSYLSDIEYLKQNCQFITNSLFD